MVFRSPRPRLIAPGALVAYRLSQGEELGKTGWRDMCEDAYKHSPLGILHTHTNQQAMTSNTSIHLLEFSSLLPSAAIKSLCS